MPQFTLAYIAKHINGEVVGDAELVITGTGEIQNADARKITFLSNPKYLSELATTKASAVIIDHKCTEKPEIPYIMCADAYFGFLQVFLLFNPQKRPLEPGVHTSAVVAESAHIGNDAAIGANVYIGNNVRIGDRTTILPNTVLLDDVSLGDDCLVYPGVTIREKCVVGNRVIIQCGAVIGSDGFGFAPSGGKFHKIPQLGIVVLEDDVEVGANTTIDRATMGETIIEAGTKLDNLIQVAHNVRVGADSVIAAQTGISGSTSIGKHAKIGGQVGTVGHIKIGDNVQIGAQSGISKSVPDNEILYGTPARTIGKAKRIEATIRSLPDLVKRIRKLEKELEEIRNQADA